VWASSARILCRFTAASWKRPVPVSSARRSSASAHPTLAELVRAARREPPRHPLDEQIKVVGETYYVKGIKHVFQSAGMPISPKGCTLEEIECILAPEPENPHDVNAVTVLVDEHHVGYLPADLAVEYAPSLVQLAGQGTLVTRVARIGTKDEAGMVRARVTICTLRLISSTDQCGRTVNVSDASHRAACENNANGKGAHWCVARSKGLTAPTSIRPPSRARESAL